MDCILIMFQAMIDGPENDGRVTASGSADLDYWMDCVEEIDEQLNKRKGL